MSVVIDTNVVISGAFFGGYPRRILEAVVNHSISAYATGEIIEEYTEVIQEMIHRKQGNLSTTLISPFLMHLHLIEEESSVHLSRDPDDDKFINCAIDSNSSFIVSGDNDLLVLERFKDIQIITAAEFCRRFLVQ